MQAPNPWIDPENYFEAYNEGLKQLHNADQLRYQALTHDLFTSQEGQEWLRLTKTFLQQEFIQLSDPNAALKLAANQGGKVTILQIEHLIAAHKAYLKQ